MSLEIFRENGLLRRPRLCRRSMLLNAGTLVSSGPTGEVIDHYVTEVSGGLAQAPSPARTGDTVRGAAHGLGSTGAEGR